MLVRSTESCVTLGCDWDSLNTDTVVAAAAAISGRGDPTGSSAPGWQAEHRGGRLVIGEFRRKRAV